MNDDKNLKNIEIPKFIGVTGERVNRDTKLNPKDQTRTSQTENRYLENMRAFTNQVRRDIDEIELTESEYNSLYIDMLINYLIDKKTVWTKNSLRQYKASAVYLIESVIKNEKDRVDGINRIKEIHHTEQELEIVNNKDVSGTASNKAKSINEDRLDLLCNRLSQLKSKYAEVTRDMFKMSLVYGMRPIEWATLDATQITTENDGVIKRVYALKIKNAKNTNNRANGEYRFIGVRNDEDFELIKKTILFIRKETNNGDRWSLFYRYIKKTIKTINMKNDKGKQITMYTARHQFSANMKNVVGTEQLAGYMGHASDKTAIIHYGKRKSGHSQYKMAGKNRDTSNNQSSYREHFSDKNQTVNNDSDRN